MSYTTEANMTDKEEWNERIQFYLAEFLSRSPEIIKEEVEEEVDES